MFYKGRAFAEHTVDYLSKNPPRGDSPILTWANFKNFSVDAVMRELGISKGVPHNAKDTNWWINNTKDSVSEKKRLFKI